MMVHSVKFTFERVIPLISAFFLLGMLVFGYGLAVGKYQIWPWGLLEQSTEVLKYFIKYGRVIPAANLFHRAPADSPRTRFYIHRPDSVMEGQYVFVGWDDEVGIFSARLYGNEGQHLHTWAWDYNELDTEGDGPRNGSTMPHAFKVLKDGSAIVSFDKGDVMARIDACGKPIWAKPGIYHHSLAFAHDGSMWTWRGGGNFAWDQYNYIVNFDPNTGNTIREIGLIEDVIQPSDARAQIFSVRTTHEFRNSAGDNYFKEKHDIFHPNDVEILSPDISEHFARFSTGDLLLSFRSPNLVVVVDPYTYEVKWSGSAPWQRQHDPDFRSDGKISIYSNGNRSVRRSEIIIVDPDTGEVSNELIGGDLEFFSGAMGKHQYLPNGNVLITVPAEGRIIETTPDGNKVLEFNNLARGMVDQNAHVENGQWLPLDYFSVDPTCPEGKN